MIDLPFSALADTLLLPYSIPMQKKHGDLLSGRSEAMKPACAATGLTRRSMTGKYASNEADEPSGL
jgi:hypothetical protein